MGEDAKRKLYEIVNQELEDEKAVFTVSGLDTKHTPLYWKRKKE